MDPWESLGMLSSPAEKHCMKLRGGSKFSLIFPRFLKCWGTFLAKLSESTPGHPNAQHSIGNLGCFSLRRMARRVATPDWLFYSAREENQSQFCGGGGRILFARELTCPKGVPHNPQPVLRITSADIQNGVLQNLCSFLSREKLLRVSSAGLARHSFRETL